MYTLHLARCELCQRLVGDFQAVAEILPDTLGELEVTPGLKEGILSQARSDIGIDTLHAAQVSEERVSERRGRRWVAPTSLGFAAAFAIVAVGLILWNFQLQQDAKILLVENVALQANLDELNQSSSNLTQLVGLVVSGASVSSISGTEQAPDAIGALVRSIRSEQSYLIANNLAKLPQNQEYQVWQITGGVPRSAGTFTVADSQDIVIPLDIGFADDDLLGVSIEPIGGSSAPTGDIVLLGPVQ